MQHLPIYRKRIRQFTDRVYARRYGRTAPLVAEFTYDRRPIPLESLGARRFKPIGPGTSWGELWGSGWFRFTGTVPSEFAGQEVVALVDTGSEGCLFVDGSPVQGLTDSARTPGDPTGKRRVPLHRRAKGGEQVSLLVEVAANALFGHHGRKTFTYSQGEIAVFNRDMWQLALDLDFLCRLAETLPEDSARAKKLWYGLNEAANVWNEGRGAAECRAICAGLLAARATASASTVWSVGHAHLDLGWLWPVRESRRKAGRTFSTALRLLNEYPDYVFGASQPQAYRWVKEDYPRLYDRVRKAVADGRWECQGAMWVEPDMNVTSGESLVRQLLFGRRFFREEFGKEVRNLWLPDVFGYSAALPQLLRQAGVTAFVTQKISWNETNVFPHHTFYWEGIDGTRIMSHFLPTNNYNLNNHPAELVEADKRFAQGDVSSDWLNLYGIGDGGGGPSRRQIEFARRAADTEGLPRVRMAPSTDFLARIAAIPPARLPVWRGELYLELHRGTLTTQARMKRYNRRLELALRDAELFAAIAGVDQREAVASVWRDTLLNQFHDILPGSSIADVYVEAHRQSEAHLAELEELVEQSLRALHGGAPGRARTFVAYNTLSWRRRTLVLLPWKGEAVSCSGPDGTPLTVQPVDGGVLAHVELPPMGYSTCSFSATAAAGPSCPTAERVSAGKWFLENALLRVEFAPDGSISSLYDREHDREVLAGGANRLLLWEDYPYSWDAWDISHYYRETTPEQAVLVGRDLVEAGPLRATIAQRLTVGGSSIEQRIEVEAGSRLVRIHNRVDWNESHRVLRVEARPALRADEATYEIQFGTVRRPTHANTSWDQARFEVAGHRFADLSQPDYGLGLVNDCKYGHAIRDGVMDLTLLRSPKDPDATADIGHHAFTFGYYPHASCFETSDLLEVAHELNSPVRVRAVGKTPEEASRSEFALEGEGVKIETVKLAEDGDALIVRLYETRGRNCSVALCSRRAWKSVREINLLEEEPRRVPGSRTGGRKTWGSTAPLAFTPFQVRSLRLEY